MKNVILIGANSIIAQNFSSQCDAFNFLHVSRKSNHISAHSNHIFYDLSLPFEASAYKQFVVQIRSSIDFSLHTVVCLFAWSGTPRTSSDPELSELIRGNNCTILDNISRLISDINVKQVLFLSSAGGIYDNDVSLVHDESSPPKPVTPYGIQKLWAESMLTRMAGELNVPVCIYRVSCVYGFNRSLPDQGVLNKWIFDSLLKGEINVYNSLDSELNFISFAQLSKSLELGIELCLSGVYNIGTSSSTYLSKVYDAVISTVPNLKVVFLDSKKRALNIDCVKFNSASGVVFDAQIEIDFFDVFNSVKSLIDSAID